MVESTEPEAAGRVCPRPGCTKALAAGVYACQGHWWELPPDIRGRISQTWWAILRSRDDGDDETARLRRKARWDAHRMATEAAEHWWAEHLGLARQMVSFQGLKTK